MLYLQIAIGIISLLMGVTQLAKEGTPVVQQAVSYSQQVLAQQRAAQQAQMNLKYHLRNQDNDWAYYSDETGRYWTRVNRRGVIEYAQNPNMIR
jgi:hypothetical protein